jgi:hypothetical protein
VQHQHQPQPMITWEFVGFIEGGWAQEPTPVYGARFRPGFTLEMSLSFTPLLHLKSCHACNQ